VQNTKIKDMWGKDQAVQLLKTENKNLKKSISFHTLYYI